MAQDYGYLANAEKFERKPCLVCDDPRPVYSWTDYHGEGYCTKCGTSYQLKGGELADGEAYPRVNVRAEWVPILRRYFAETGKLNGCGTYMSMGDYPEQLEGLRAFSEWADAHKDILPKPVASA
jgi:hypothetical protein